MEKSHIDWLLRAVNNAQKSPDPSTQNGSVLVTNCPGGIAWYDGYNRPTIPCDVSKLTRDEKMNIMEHAERVALYSSAKWGESGSEDSTLYCIWFACPDCARAIVECGVREVIGLKSMYDSTPERWKMPVEIGLDILRRGGVEHSFIDHHFGEEILFSGEKKLI